MGLNRERLAFLGWLVVWFASMAGLIALLVIAACVAPAKPPVVVPAPPPPAVRSVQVTVRNALNPTATLLTDDGEVVNCDVVHLPDGVPRLVCVLNVATPAPFGAHLTITAPDRRELRVDFALQDFTGDAVQELPDLTLSVLRVDLPRLHPEGQHLRAADGSRFTIIEHTDFNLAGLIASGQDIGPVLDQRAQIGFNVLRVFTAYDVPGIGRLWPKEHADIYAGILTAVIDQASLRNLRVELVAFTGPYPFFGSDDEKVAHWEMVKSVACSRPGNVILELVNEYDNAPNTGLPFDRLTPPDCGVLASHGSAIQDGQPKTPYWSIVTFHPASNEWWRKTGHNAMELWNGPSYSNEVTRFPDNDANCQHAYDSGAGNSLLSAGGDFHSVEGKRSALLTGIALACAQQFVAGAKSIPLDCQDGGYVNKGDVPGLLRQYQRGGDPRCVVGIRP